MSYVKSTVSEVLALCEQKLLQIATARKGAMNDLRTKLHAKPAKRRWFWLRQPLSFEQIRRYIYNKLWSVPDIYYRDTEDRVYELLDMCRTGSQEVLLSVEDAAMLKS
jgi:hypothetical protein